MWGEGGEQGSIGECSRVRGERRNVGVGKCGAKNVEIEKNIEEERIQASSSRR